MLPFGSLHESFHISCKVTLSCSKRICFSTDATVFSTYDVVLTCTSFQFTLERMIGRIFSELTKKSVVVSPAIRSSRDLNAKRKENAIRLPNCTLLVPRHILIRGGPHCNWTTCFWKNMYLGGLLCPSGSSHRHCQHG